MKRGIRGSEVNSAAIPFIGMSAMVLSSGALFGGETPTLPCAVDETALLRAPTSVPGPVLTEFGRAIAVDGDIAVVGSKGDATGAAYVLNRQEGEWHVGQQLSASSLATNDDFGAAVAVRGAVAAVGAPNHDVGASDNGAVFVFMFDGAAWSQQQVVTPPDAQASRWFGAAVAIVDDLLWVGAPGDHHLGFILSGAVYRYRFDGAQWQFEEKLVGSDSRDDRRLGSRVDAETGRLVAAGGAPGAGLRTVSVFDLAAGVWAEQDILTCPDAPPLIGSSFGDSVSLEGGTLAIGAPMVDARGRAYIFRRDIDGQWVAEQTLLSPTTQFGDRFGHAVALQGSTLVVTAERMTQTHDIGTNTWDSANAGGGFVFEHIGGTWSMRHLLRRRFIDNTGDNPAAVNDRLGGAAALAGDDILVGAAFVEKGPHPATTPIGAVLTFDVTPPDCDRNGVPDVCDIDCNHNLSPDACDIAQSLSGDCDLNGEPDECQVQPVYQMDNGHGQYAWGLDSGGDMIWLSQFNVVPGGQRLTHIALPWIGWTPHGTPVTLLVYDDPNNDGEPLDAALLSTTTVVATDRFGLSTTPTFSILAITPTVVGEPGDSFFIGGYVQCLPDVYVALADNGVSMHRSWMWTDAFGKGDIVNLANNNTFLPTPTNFMLRALALDCNGNGAWDDCDIATGASQDLNGNAIPDECEGPICVADIAPIGAPNGSVNVDDLLAVINAWGPCANPNNCPADIAPPGPPQGNDVVNVDDLLAVINSWGACP